jgi:hypothetical protein
VCWLTAGIAHASRSRANNGRTFDDAVSSDAAPFCDSPCSRARLLRRMTCDQADSMQRRGGSVPAIGIGEEEVREYIEIGLSIAQHGVTRGRS